MLHDLLRFLRRALPTGLLLVLLAACAGTALAQETEEEGPRVGTVSVTGNVHTDSTRILRTFEVLPGSRFSQDAVRRGVRKLVALGLFNDVKVNRVEHDGVIGLVIAVVERPKVGWIKYSGNKKREDVDLEKKTFLRAGDTYSAV